MAFSFNGNYFEGDFLVKFQKFFKPLGFNFRYPMGIANVIYTRRNFMIFAPIESPEHELLIGAKIMKFREV